MMDLLFNVIVMPIQLVLEYIFSSVYSISSNISLSILILSFCVFIFTLPLYLRADSLQKEEREIQEKLAPKVQQIKKHYSGDERHLLLQTYYRQMNYHPIMGLRLVLSLLLQIPIFLAAYTFFSNLQILDGMSCGYISNLSLPDELLKIGNWKINLLPILMTIVNIQAGLIYSKDKSFKENKNLIIMSLIFLVLLYNSPAALVLYWLYNNIFSLLKNVLLSAMSRHNFLLCICFITLFVSCLFSIAYNLTLVPTLLALLIFLILQNERINKIKVQFKYPKLFYLCIIGFWVLLGVFVPSNVIASDFTEFIFPTDNPINILMYSILIFGGFYLFWGSWLYYFSNETTKKVLAVVGSLGFVATTIGIFLIKMPDVILSNTFNFATERPDFYNYLISPEFYYAILILSCIFIILLILKNRVEVINKIFLSIILTCLIISFSNISQMIINVSKYDKTKFRDNVISGKYINLSKTNKNVLIIFLDRAINSYFPIILKEFPELNEKFQGFKYYPNTLSYSDITILGYPPILGGYEYTPLEMDRRNVVFERKFSEANTVLPAIFSLNNWTSNVINPITFKEEYELGNITDKEREIIHEIMLYDNFNISTFDIPASSDLFVAQMTGSTPQITKRNLIFYSLLSALPSEFRLDFYDNGKYNALDLKDRQYPARFLNSYAELLYLPELTEFNAKNNTFTVFNNELTHNPVLLTYPAYDINWANHNPEYKSLGPEEHKFSLEHYHVNVLALKLLGKYFEFLKEQDVFDNTRIIIVADHGFINIQNPNKNIFFTNNYFNCNPLLLVKDFNDKEPIRTQNEFMTNADVPFLATQGIITEPINPFTSKKISNSEKNNGLVTIKKIGPAWEPRYYFGKTNFLSEKDRFNFVKNDPNKEDNWILNLSYSEALKLSEEK